MQHSHVTTPTHSRGYPNRPSEWLASHAANELLKKGHCRLTEANAVHIGKHSCGSSQPLQATHNEASRLRVSGYSTKVGIHSKRIKSDTEKNAAREPLHALMGAHTRRQTQSGLVSSFAPRNRLPYVAILNNNAKHSNFPASYLAGTTFWPTKHAIR
jgi:hypothetical protein